MKFLADMCVSLRCVKWLRSQGYDAVHLFEQGLHKLSDADVLRKVDSEKRILLTMDLDFVQLLVGTPANDIPLAVIFRLSDQRPLNVQAILEAILPIIKQYSERGNAIFSVGDKKIRIRHLPIT